MGDPQTSWKVKMILSISAQVNSFVLEMLIANQALIVSNISSIFIGGNVKIKSVLEFYNIYS